MSKCEAKIKIEVGEWSRSFITCQYTELTNEGYFVKGNNCEAVEELKNLSTDLINRVCARKLEESVESPVPEFIEIYPD